MMADASKVVHILKCWPDFFDAIKSGRKTFDIRKNDRGFQAGDVLVLQKYDPKAPSFEGPYVGVGGYYTPHSKHAQQLTVRVTYVLNGFGLEPGYVCMALAEVS